MWTRECYSWVPSDRSILTPNTCEQNDKVAAKNFCLWWIFCLYRNEHSKYWIQLLYTLSRIKRSVTNYYETIKTNFLPYHEKINESYDISFLSLEYFQLLFLPIFIFRRSSPEVFLQKCILKICSKVTGEHPCWSVIEVAKQIYWNHVLTW